MTPPALSITGKVEKKVTAATIGTYVAGVVLLAILTGVQSNPGLISGFPDWLESILLPLVPAAVAFLSGWNAKHTPRPDLEEPAVPPQSRNVVYRDTATGQPTQPDPIIKPGEAGPHGP